MAQPALYLDVRDNIAPLIARITEYERKSIPFVTAYALTKTGQDVKAGEIKEMEAVFDRPTRFALNSLFLQTATKQTLTAIVHFKDGFGSIPAWRYLQPQIMGGGRRHKSFEKALIRAGLMKSDEYAMPGKGVALDAYGNMKGGLITRILSDIGANTDPLSNSTARSRRTKKGRARGRYFVLRPEQEFGSSTSTRDVQPGIYHRKGTADVVPVIVFTGAPSYKKRFAFFEKGREIFGNRFGYWFAEGWARFAPRSTLRKAA